MMIRRTIGRIVDLYLIVLAGWAVAWQTLHDRWGALALVNAWAFWILITGLPVGVTRLLWRRSRWLAAGWLAGGLALLWTRYRHALTAWLPAPTRQEAAPPQAAASAAAQPLRLLSFNLLRDNYHTDIAASVVAAQNADVVLLQELEPRMYARLRRVLAHYPHQHWRPHHRSGSGMGVFSRYPLEPSGLWQSFSLRPYALRVTLQMPAGPVDVYSIHLLSVGQAAMHKTGFDGNFRERERQVRTLVAEVKDRRCPALLLGDHNMTEGNEAYRIAAAGLVDAWTVAGRGPGWTWPRTGAPFHEPEEMRRPQLRLDYCFCTPDVHPQHMQVIDEWTGSDHCPIVVDALISHAGGPNGNT
jgi:endonuclease/exonuclease/phosphatase (EEP) superfamily protein YafD